MERLPEEGNLDTPDLLAREVIQVDAGDEEADCTAETSADDVDDVAAAEDRPRSEAAGTEAAVAAVPAAVLARRPCCRHGGPVRSSACPSSPTPAHPALQDRLRSKRDRWHHREVR